MDCFVALLHAMTEKRLSSTAAPRSSPQKSAPARSPASAPGCCRNRGWPLPSASRHASGTSSRHSHLVTPKPLTASEQDALPVGDAEFEAGGDPPGPFDEMRFRL